MSKYYLIRVAIRCGPQRFFCHTEKSTAAIDATAWHHMSPDCKLDCSLTSESVWKVVALDGKTLGSIEYDGGDTSCSVTIANNVAHNHCGESSAKDAGNK